MDMIQLRKFMLMFACFAKPYMKNFFDFVNNVNYPYAKTVIRKYFVRMKFLDFLKTNFNYF